MPSISGIAAGVIATLYYEPTVIVTKSLANVANTAIEANEVNLVADMGALENVRNLIDISKYGADSMGKLPGQSDPGTFDFTVHLDMSDDIHTELRDDAGTTEHSFVVKFTKGAQASYAVFDGYVASASVTMAIDDSIKMDVSIARSGGITWVNAA